MKSALLIVLSMNRQGQSLFQGSPFQNERTQGWRMMQRARRICRRLGVQPEAVL